MTLLTNKNLKKTLLMSHGHWMMSCSHSMTSCFRLKTSHSHLIKVALIWECNIHNVKMKCHMCAISTLCQTTPHQYHATLVPIQHHIMLCHFITHVNAMSYHDMLTLSHVITISSTMVVFSWQRGHI